MLVMCPFRASPCPFVTCPFGADLLENHSPKPKRPNKHCTSSGPLNSTAASAVAVPCLFGNGPIGPTACSFVERTVHRNNFTLDTPLPWVLSNKPTKCQVDRKIGCGENPIRDKHTHPYIHTYIHYSYPYMNLCSLSVHSSHRWCESDSECSIV